MNAVNNAIFSENGIINQAEKAKDMTANSTIKEEEDLNILLTEFENEQEQPEISENWDPDKVKPVTSEDGEIVPVPKGYVASTVEGEKSVNTGFVIKEGTDGSLTKGINEFVWVPVRDISDIYDEANNAGQLWNFSETTSTKRTYPTLQSNEYREPDILTGAILGNDSSSGSEYDAVSSNLQQAGLSSTATAADFKTQLQNEFNSMIESVKVYKGFYIGRYETGDLSKAKAVVKKGNGDISNQTWYTMYKVNQTIGANNNVATGIIWECQWDATIRWMQNEGVTDIVKKYPTNSAEYGNYKDNAISYVDTDGMTKTTTSGTETKIPTGSAEITKINNIYDMAGNVYDWTMESGYSDSHMSRGGCYNSSSGLSRPASYRYYNYPTSTYNYNGSRTALYITL